MRFNSAFKGLIMTNMAESAARKQQSVNFTADLILLSPDRSELQCSGAFFVFRLIRGSELGEFLTGRMAYQSGK
jgi:hypothetical protein